MSPRDAQTTPSHGDVLTAISDGIASRLNELHGRGPTQAKSYHEGRPGRVPDARGFSRVEQTLLEGGRGSAVIQQRMQFQELMRERFANVTEHATGRHMSGKQQDPDIMSELFIVAPTDLVDDHEIPE